jgi:hypothetical protein
LLLDSIIQELDIATGQVLWEWHAYGHVPVSASSAGKPGRAPYDFFHLNSVQPLPGGKLLISARHTWSVYELDMASGRVLFTLGGKRSDFKLPAGAQFEWQHNATWQPDGTITLLDNADGPTGSGTERESRALRLRLDLAARRATLVQSLADRPSLLASSQGNVQVLPDGNTFVGWGAQPYFTEFGRRGRQLFSLHFASQLQSYRGYRFPWWGQPTTPPAISVSATRRGATVYASWNGATTVAAWRVLAGSSPAQLFYAGQAPNTFFESTIQTFSARTYFEVQALDADGRVLGTSAVVKR